MLKTVKDPVSVGSDVSRCKVKKAFLLLSLVWSAERSKTRKQLRRPGIGGRRRRGRQRLRWSGSITNSMDMSLSKLWEIVKHREAWHAEVLGVTKSWTRLSD